MGRGNAHARKGWLLEEPSAERGELNQNLSPVSNSKAAQTSWRSKRTAIRRCTFLGYPAIPCIDPLVAHTCKISRRISRLFKICIGEHPTSGVPVTIVTGTSGVGKHGETYYSYALPSDVMRGRSNALIFSDLLYAPKDILSAIVARAFHARTVLESDSPIIPFRHHQDIHLDVYTEFLKRFQHGVPLVSLMATARMLIPSSREKDSTRKALSIFAMPFSRALEIASELLKLSQELHDSTSSLASTICAADFAERMFECGCSGEETLQVASLISGTPFVAGTKPAVGFPFYVAKHLDGHYSRG